MLVVETAALSSMTRRPICSNSCSTSKSSKRVARGRMPPAAGADVGYSIDRCRAGRAGGLRSRPARRGKSGRMTYLAERTRRSQPSTTSPSGTLSISFSANSRRPSRSNSSCSRWVASEMASRMPSGARGGRCARVEQHVLRRSARSHGSRGTLHALAPAQHLFEQPPQRRDVPLAIAELCTAGARSSPRAGRRTARGTPDWPARS